MLVCHMRVLPALIAPLRLTFWVLVAGMAVIIFLVGVGAARHLQRVRDSRRREHVQRELEPVFGRFLDTHDASHLSELRPVFLRMDASHRPVAALLTIELMHEAPPAQRSQIVMALERSGIVELGERGTRRRSPWRRAMACEVLGSIGAPRSVPALLARLTDRRPEVRIAAVRALGDIRSEEAVPALSEAFLERRVAPTNIVNNALRRIGGEAASTFQLGIVSADPIVRVSSCFGLSGIGGGQAATTHLSKVLISDTDTRVRAAAAAALGIVGGEQVPTELIGAAADPDVNVRRHAVKALGSFDDPTTGMILVACTEDEDRETALRAAEALVALSHRPRAGPEVRAQLESCPAWAIQYIRQVAEVTA